MVIHTPRLCGEPGFRTRLEQREEAPIRCREVLDTPEAVAEATHPEMKESASPQTRTRRPRAQNQGRISGAAHGAEGGGAGGGGATMAGDREKEKLETDRKTQEIVRKALRSLFGDSVSVEGDDAGDGKTFMVSDEEGDVLVDIQFVDLDNMDAAADSGGSLLEQLDRAINEASGSIERLEEAMRAAGYDVSSVNTKKNGEGGGERRSEREAEQGEATADSKDSERKPNVKHEEL